MITLDLNTTKENKLGLAVSGGGDSVALLKLAAEQLPLDQLVVLHFDHQLRPESSADAEFVADLANTLNIKCIIGKPTEDVQGNMEQWARQQRYQFFADQAKALKLSCIATAHTADDVAETFLLRASKGSGLKGLAAMQQEALINQVSIVRPLLGHSRAELRAYLEKQEQVWLEDPHNTDDKFARARLRNARSALESAGIDFSAVAACATSLRRATDALEGIIQTKLVEYAQMHNDTLELDRAVLKEPLEIQQEILRTAILKVAPAHQAPRTSKRLRALEKMQTEQLPYELGGVSIQLVENYFLFRRS